ncbi:synaptic vesicle glycoprotein 2B-like [Drosophila innubila]|uniref:synaptic vesicle glycoprotein 2B-like n=1 Tax=Drosophila innubila TaxID=198719 RepID=UPI00148B6748|nr:synaptic vesicle glycoprotein 2B-like [Drosophila innubila]
MSTDIDVVLDLIGLGWTQLLIFLSCSMAMIYFVNEIMGISIVAISIACEFNLSPTELFLLRSAGFMGMILFTYYVGYKSDQIGRRKAMLYSLVMSLISSAISLTMPIFYCFLICRIIAGLSLSGIMATAFTYLMEYTTIQVRPRMANFFTYAVVMSFIFVPLLAHVFEPLHTVLWSMGSFHVRVWRLCMLLNLIPGIIALIAFSVLPESAKYLLSVGNNEAAYEILNRLCLSNRRESLETLNVTRVTQAHIPPILEKQSNCIYRLWYETLPLFKPPYVKQYVIIVLIICAYFFVGNGFQLWFTAIRYQLTNKRSIMCDHLKEDNSSPNDSMCTDKPINYTESIILGLSALCTCAWITILLCFLSRRSIMLVNAVISTIGGLSLNFVKNQLLQLFAMVIFITMLIMAIPLANSAIADMVPTYLRGKAMSFSLTLARLSVIIANSIIGHFLYDYCLITFNIFVLVVIAIVILIAILRV